MQNFIYPDTLTPDKKDGGFVVKFGDVPEEQSPRARRLTTHFLKQLIVWKRLSPIALCWGCRFQNRHGLRKGNTPCHCLRRLLLKLHCILPLEKHGLPKSNLLNGSAAMKKKCAAYLIHIIPLNCHALNQPWQRWGRSWL